MNIGIFTDCWSPTPNGVASSAAVLAAGLERRGHRVTVFAPAFPGRAGSDANVILVPSVPALPSVGIRWARPDLRELGRIAENRALDLIHTHSEFPMAMAARRVAAGLGIPLVHTAHTIYEHYRHYAPLGFLIPEAAIRACWRGFLHPYSLVVCPSRTTLSYFADLVPGLASAEIPNGIDLDRFGVGAVASGEIGDFRRGLGVPDGARIILYVGRIAREKRAHQLIDALLPVLAGFPDARLLMVGGGPGFGATRKRVRKLGMREKVLLPGYLSHGRIPVACATAALFATASLSENHPMTAIEAAASGLPLVARRDESLDGLVDDGRSGLLADTDGDLAIHAAHLLSDETTRTAFALASRALAARFSADRHAEAMEGAYARAVLAHRAGRR
ncbi:MAG: glycosyltransferase [Spirochaetes bacterium]|nr:glycosyltransferase [Spirochaetota bacterium]